jgi:DNA-binding NtrC family response regulator
MPIMLGQSQAIMLVRAQLQRYAQCDAAVLIEGETGTGKELAAREIHYASQRRGRPFVPVNCGAIPDSLVESELFGHRRGAFTDAKTAQEGLVERACGGTLFLDEVDSLSTKAQVTLLRFLQDSEYRPVGGGATRTSDARIIAATNANLEQLTGEGRFRRDLQYRLNPLYVQLPPLRARLADVDVLAEHFLAGVARRLNAAPKRWTAAALSTLSTHVWPGNVRELENVVLRAFLRTDTDCIGRAELIDVEPALGLTHGDVRPADTNACFSTAKLRAIHVFERDYLTGLMRRASGNVTAAARLSGTERRQLGRLLKKHGIEKHQFRLG